MKKIKLTTFLNILLSILVIVSIIYCYFNYKNAELRYGIKGINENEGKIKTKIEYEEIEVFTYYDGKYYFEVIKNGKNGIIDEEGKKIIDCKYDGIRLNNKGYCAIAIKGYGWGLINKKGEQIIECKYDSISDFTEKGYAMIDLNGKKGIINTKGEQIIECKYDDIDWSFKERYLITILGDNKKYGLIDINEGKVIVDNIFDSIIKCFEETFLLEKDGITYYYKPEENYIEKIENNWKEELKKGYAILKLDKDYGILTLEDTFTGENIVCNEFNKYGGAWIETGENYGYINKNGEILLEYNYVKPVDDEYAVVGDVNSECGLINCKTLELTIECKYNFIYEISKDYLIAYGNETNYILDKQGNVIKECKYRNIVEDPYNQGYYMTITEDNKRGLIDENFNEILECKYDEGYTDKGIIIYTESNKGITMFDLNLNKINRLDEYDEVYLAEEEYIIVKKDDKYGVIDSQGNEILAVVGRKEINITFIISTILGSIFAIALVVNNVCSKRRKDF